MQGIAIKLTSNKFGDLARRLPQVVNEICETSAKAIEVDAKASMGEPKSGRIYSIGGVDHQASAPGESPAIETGNLLSGIQTEADGATRWVVYTTASYSVELEYGAPARNLMPRPFFVPAAERERPKFLGALQDLEDRLR